MREKLIELINEAKYCTSIDADVMYCDVCEYRAVAGGCTAARIADHLIKNGVVIVGEVTG